MHCSRTEDGVEAFVELGTLIVEGRLPAEGTARGYIEGPHCPRPTNLLNPHQCDPADFLCMRAERLRKHLSLLCSNAVPMCVEVLLCPVCPCGTDRARSPEVANIPSSSDLLLEQWTVSVVHISDSPCNMSVRSLLQAVRSQLHFSQLSAWWSSSRGARPTNVCYRVTLPERAFVSHFCRQPQQHTFPPAAVGPGTQLKVSVRTLPRSEVPPSVACATCTPDNNMRKRSIGLEQPLLGESLLDPPGPSSSSRAHGPDNKDNSSLHDPCPSPSKEVETLSLSDETSLSLIPPAEEGPDNKDNSSLHDPCPSPSKEVETLSLSDETSLSLIPPAEEVFIGQARKILSEGQPGIEVPRDKEERAGLCKWHTGSPPSPPRRRPSRQVMTRRCDKHQHPSSRHILPLPGSWSKEHAPPLSDPKPSCSFSLSPPSNLSSTAPPDQGPVDDRMQTNCNQHGKHDCRCEEDGDDPHNKINLELSKKEMEEVLTVLRVRVGDSDNITPKPEKVSGKGDLLLSAILRSSQPTPVPPVSFKRKLEHDQNFENFIPPSTHLDSKFSNYPKKHPPLEILPPDKFKEKTIKEIMMPSPEPKKLEKRTGDNPTWKEVPSNNSSLKEELSDNDVIKDTSSNVFCSMVNRFRTKQCVKKDETTKCQLPVSDYFVEEFSNLDLNKRVETPQVPSALDKAKFRRSLDSAASMVFHWRTGLPLTSSPAPMRRTSHRFDFDSSINSVSAIRSALFDSESGDDTESDSSKSPCSPQIDIPSKGEPWAIHYQSPGSALLGSFEESVLNGRLEPVSTVHGFTADLGASGSFCPPHLVLPVTVFFYTLGDNDKVSTPYLAHINLGKKGYVVPRSGTIQVTLLNPLGTVIKMFVVLYNLTDMPSNSHTFVRQRTLYMPAGLSQPVDNSQKYLRYLIHLRFASSKSGRVSLHTDIRMIIFRKSDMDTASGHGADTAYEMRSFTSGPTNPKFSPRK